MLAAHVLECAIDAGDMSAINSLRSQIWNALANEYISDEEAQHLSNKIEEKARGFKPSSPKPSFKRPSIFKPRKLQKSPNPKASLVRRRENSRYAMSPKMSGQFTNGELSVFLIVAEECRINGHCDRSIAEIAARAGVCRALAQRALRLAMSLRLLLIQERPVRGQKNQTNVIRIISEEWLTWTNRRSKPIGSKSVNPTNKTNNNKGFSSTFDPFKKPENVGERYGRRVLDVGRVKKGLDGLRNAKE